MRCDVLQDRNTDVRNNYISTRLLNRGSCEFDLVSPDTNPRLLLERIPLLPGLIYRAALNVTALKFPTTPSIANFSIDGLHLFDDIRPEPVSTDFPGSFLTNTVS
jgi:hypothetical protein